MRNLIVAAAVAAACLTSTAFAADETTKISGKAFIDFTNISSDPDTAADGYGVDVKRFYVGIDHVFNDVWSANVTTDFQYLNAVTSVSTTKDNAGNVTGVTTKSGPAAEVYIKKAYVQFKASDAFTLRVGSADLPWVPYVEDIYGFRYLEQVMIDRTKFGTSTDWGLHASGKAADGMFNYAVALVNGRGYKDTTRSKTMDIEARVGFVPVTGLNLGLGFRSGKLGQDVQPANGGPSPAKETASRVNALVAYKADMFGVGVEYFTAKNYSNDIVTGKSPTDKADGYSLFGSVKFNDQVGAFARIEQVKPNKDTASDTKNKYLNVGVSYAVRKNIDLAFAYKQTKTETASSDAKVNEIGVWSQVKF